MKVLALLLLLSACNTDPTLGGACAARCDCPQNNAPVKCPGEWQCNSDVSSAFGHADHRCEYRCTQECDSTGISTCRAGEECANNRCTMRKGCN